MSWDLSLAGYLREALVVAERYLEIDPLSLPANNTYWRALYAVGRTDDAFAAMEVLEQLGGNNSAWVRGRLDLNEGKDESAIANFEAQLQLEGFADTSWVRELVIGARSSTNGPAFLDRRIPEIVASMKKTLEEWVESCQRSNNGDDYV